MIKIKCSICGIEVINPKMYFSTCGKKECKKEYQKEWKKEICQIN